MKLKYSYYTVFVFLLAGCGGPQFSQPEPKPAVSTGASILEGIKQTAANSGQCSEQRTKLIAENENEVVLKNLIEELLKLAPKEIGETKIDIKTIAEAYYARPNDADPMSDIVGILTSNGFKTVLKETAILIEQVVNDKMIMDHLASIHADLNGKSGDKVAELLELLANDAQIRDTLLGLVKVECNNKTQKNLADLWLSPKIFLGKFGAKGIAVLMSDFTVHAHSLYKTLSAITIHPDITKFKDLVMGIAPKPDFCSINDLDAYQKHFELAAKLLQAPTDSKQLRPLRTVLNLLVRMWTMEEANSCTGFSYDELKQENLRDTLLMISGLIRKVLE